MCKVLQEAIQVQQEWSSMHSIYNATPKQGLCVCVCMCVERETEREEESERVVLPLECATECLFISVVIQNDAEEHQSSVRLLNFADCSAQLSSGRVSPPPLSASVDRLNTARFQGQNEESLSHKIKTR